MRDNTKSALCPCFPKGELAGKMMVPNPFRAKFHFPSAINLPLQKGKKGDLNFFTASEDQWQGEFGTIQTSSRYKKEERKP
jgi:hypothetical protein